MEAEGIAEWGWEATRAGMDANNTLRPMSSQGWQSTSRTAFISKLTMASTVSASVVLAPMARVAPTPRNVVAAPAAARYAALPFPPPHVGPASWHIWRRALGQSVPQQWHAYGPWVYVDRLHKPSTSPAAPRVAVRTSGSTGRGCAQGTTGDIR